MSATIYRLEGVVKRYHRPDGGIEFEMAVPHLELRAGDRLALSAPSGAGKSTLLNMLLLAMSPSEAVAFDIFLPEGRSADVVTLWHADRRRQLGALRRELLGFVLQTGGLLPFLSVRQNITLPSQLRGRSVAAGDLADLADSLGIAALLERKPDQLSVGERQRVSLARALAARPAVLVADEPSASLDRQNAEAIMQLLLQQAGRLGTCIVLASHDTALIERHGLEQLSFAAERGEDGHARSLFWREDDTRCV